LPDPKDIDMPLRFLTSGESHGPALSAILDGMPAGIPLQADLLNKDLARRQQGYGAGPRMKIETDTARILGGVMEGQSTGAPLSFQIENRDHGKWRGRTIPAFSNPRPGHADLTGALKFGYTDLRPALERASARETAARVAVGAVCRQFLAQFGIQVGGYVSAIGDVSANLDSMHYTERIARALDSDVSCPEESAASQMQAAIRQTMTERDTLGGIIEVVALNLPVGLGSYTQWDKRLEARLGAAVLSIQAIKGVEFGPAFENAHLPGTRAHDPILLDRNRLVRPTERSGGLEGGITTGQPLVVRAAMKPIATTLTPQPSVNLANGQPEATNYERSDFCPVPRAVVIVEAMVAFVLADALLEKLGGDSIAEMLPRFAALKQARLDDLPIQSKERLFWPEE
jgi:chorismate synthase